MCQIACLFCYLQDKQQTKSTDCQKDRHLTPVSSQHDKCF